MMVLRKTDKLIVEQSFLPIVFGCSGLATHMSLIHFFINNWLQGMSRFFSGVITAKPDWWKCTHDNGNTKKRTTRLLYIQDAKSKCLLRFSFVELTLEGTLE